MNPLTNIRNIVKLNEQELKLGVFDERHSWHSQYKDSAYIFIGGLPYDLTEGDVLCVFSQYGEIVNINLVRDKKTGKTKGYGFIAFEDQRSSILAVDNLNGIKLGGRTIRVDHVEEYRRPKGDEKDEKGKFLEKLETGCAPQTPSESDTDEDQDVRKKKKKEKKKRKEEKKEKRRAKENELNPASTGENSEFRKGFSHKEIKQEKKHDEQKQNNSKSTREKDIDGRSVQEHKQSKDERRQRDVIYADRREGKERGRHTNDEESRGHRREHDNREKRERRKRTRSRSRSPMHRR